jgi:hypothetical protein
MWGGNLIEVALLGWSIEGVHNEVALRTLYPVAAAALEVAEVSRATVVSAVVVSTEMAVSEAKAVSKAAVGLKAAAATSAVATAICTEKSARVLAEKWLGASFDCRRGP